MITELQGVESGVTLRGRFALPRYAGLSADQGRFLETFLRCRGMLNSVERELGISYPTARGRLDAVLKALDLHAPREEGAEPSPVAPVSEEPTPSMWETIAEPDEPTFEAVPEPEPPPENSRDELLTLLERGEITVDELKKRLGGAK